ncbi:MAG: DUF2147 domain-containing protein [Pseudomonadota bacterium]|nr:DUF2147 domain-containing protein [Pseudomonadota bacterium]
MTRRLSALAFAALISSAGLTGIANAADPILGQWQAPGGGVVKVSACGNAFCAKVISGDHKGKSVGTMRGSGGDYTGTVTDPRDDKTYEGSATIASNGKTLKLTGCALKIFCKTQTWTRI